MVDADRLGILGLAGLLSLCCLGLAALAGGAALGGGAVAGATIVSTGGGNISAALVSGLTTAFTLLGIALLLRWRVRARDS